MRNGRTTGTAGGGAGLSCAVALCIGAAAGTLADGAMPQTEVYDGLANTAYSSEYMNRADYQGSVNSVGSCDGAAYAAGSGASSGVAATAGEKGFEPFSSFALESPARGLDSREPRGFFVRIY